MKAGGKIIQYRNKIENHDDQVSSVKEILAAADSFDDVKIIVNDSLEVALESGAHGVHLGQDDGDFKSICRDYWQRLIIGVSIDNVPEAIEAEKAGAHYIGAGAVYGSDTKPEAPFMGVPLLRDICRSVSVPVSAIGGITFEKLDEILDAEVGFVCVISDINAHTDPIARAKQYLNKLENK